MRVPQLGVGSVGEVTMLAIAGVPEVSSVLVADLDEPRAQEVAVKLPPGKAAAR